MLATRRDRVTIANRLQQKLDSLDVTDTEHFSEFNALVIELTGNQTLLLLTAMLEHITTAAAVSFVRSVQHPDDQVRLARKAARTRQRLIDLIRSGDADGAEALWRTHLVEAGRVLVEGAGDNLVDLFS
jgi:DNA-binding GntR family transcriptional regulator